MKNSFGRLYLVTFVVGALIFSPWAAAAEKGGMPDLIQIENTCLPTSTANVIIWLGKHGYPKLILPGATTEEREDHTVHLLMADTGARYDFGTSMETITSGITKYINRAGYQCDVEYRGMEGKGASFTQDWLQQNDDPNKVFVLLLAYCRFHPEDDSFSYAWNAGHAVTLVNAESDMILIHDPAHDISETGRKILTPRALTSGSFQDQGTNVPVAGLCLLSGSLLGAPEDAGVMLTGAVCITMKVPGSPTPISPSGPGAILAGTAGASGVTGSATSTHESAQSSTWWTWIFDYCFGK